MVNYYQSQFNFTDAISPYDTAGSLQNLQATPESDFDYLISPLEQYRRTQAQRIGTDYFDSPFHARRAMERRFEPLYGLYSAAEPSGRYATFADFLRAEPAVTGADVTAAAQNVRDLTAAANPIQYSLYYGGEGIGQEAALDRQRRLARTQMLSSMGPRAAFNPTLQTAARGAVNQMYQNYVAGARDDMFRGQGPTGFMNYYLQQRNL